MNQAYLEAVEAMDAGAIGKLEKLAGGDPRLVEDRCFEGRWYEHGYFRGAMLLHHVAGNPIRVPLPANVLDVARALLDLGARADAVTEAGWTTIGLLLTGKQASEAGVAVPLMELLRSRGDGTEFLDARALNWALMNCAPGTAEELILRGAPMDLRHAAGLGRIGDVERLLRVQWELREEALLLACIRGEEAAGRMLVAAGARGDVLAALEGEPVRTALHEAANRGHEGLVRLMVEKGANLGVVEPQFQGTAAGWARHGGHEGIARLLE